MYLTTLLRVNKRKQSCFNSFSGDWGYTPGNPPRGRCRVFFQRLRSPLYVYDLKPFIIWSLLWIKGSLLPQSLTTSGSSELFFVTGGNLKAPYQTTNRALLLRLLWGVVHTSRLSRPPAHEHKWQRKPEPRCAVSLGSPRLGPASSPMSPRWLLPVLWALSAEADFFQLDSISNVSTYYFNYFYCNIWEGDCQPNQDDATQQGKKNKMMKGWLLWKIVAFVQYPCVSDICLWLPVPTRDLWAGFPQDYVSLLHQWYCSLGQCCESGDCRITNNITGRSSQSSLMPICL